MAYDIQDLHQFQSTHEFHDDDNDIVTQDALDMPSTLTSILDPQDALEAAQRMQRWYRSTAQGLSRIHI